MPDSQVQSNKINMYPSNKTVLQINGDAVHQYPSNKKLLVVQGDAVHQYPSNTKLFTVKNGDIIEYPSNKKIGKAGGDGVTINGRGVSVKGLGRYNPVLCAAVGLALLNPL